MSRLIPALAALAAIAFYTAPLRADSFVSYEFATDSYFVRGIDDAGDVFVSEYAQDKFGNNYYIYTNGQLVYGSAIFPSFFVADDGSPCAAPTLPTGEVATESVCNGDRQVYQANQSGSAFTSLFEIYPGSSPLGVQAAPTGYQSQLVVNPNGDYAFVEEVNHGGVIGEVVDVTPEPASFTLLGTGSFGLLYLLRRKRAVTASNQSPL